MGRLGRRAVLVAALLGLALTTPGPPASASHTVPVSVTITRVVDVFDDFDELSDADIYVKVTINGVEQNGVASHTDDEEEVEPFWTFSTNVSGEEPTVPVSIQVWDHEDCDHDTSCSDDQQADADPGSGTTLDLSVDMATGTWSGDTSTTCAQGNSSELRARICFSISTLSASGDADGDGLLDGWETTGYDHDGDGTIDVNLPAFGANFRHKDLFLEFDFMAGAIPSRAQIQALKAAFAAAPIDAGSQAHLQLDPDDNPGLSAPPNPDGLPGINLWVDTGGLMEGGLLVGDNLGGGNQIGNFEFCGVDDGDFYDAKDANFAAARRQIFRYAISADPTVDDCDTGGQGEIGGNDFTEFNHDAGTIMHELGHNLNLHHGGHTDFNCKPNYISVMNYNLQFGIPQVGGGSILDYSAPRFTGGRGNAPLPTLQEDALSEQAILDPTDASNMTVFSNGNGTITMSPLNQPIDWDGDGTIDGGTVTVNVDDDGDSGPEACDNSDDDEERFGSEDWRHISLHPRHFADFDDGAKTPGPQDEPTTEEMLELQQALNTTDLSLDITDTPDPAAAGGTLSYALQVTNLGPNPANDLQLTQTLPTGVTYVSDDGGCSGGPSGNLSCDLGYLLARATRTVNVTVLIAADLVHQAGGPVTVTTTATVTNLAGPDSNPSNNAASESTTVIAMADLEVVSFSAAGQPPELLIGQTAEVVFTTVSTNHGPSSPMDAHLSGTALASVGATVTPASFAAELPALAIGEQRAAAQAFTLGCQQPGAHVYTFQVTIAPSHPEDVDPDLSNNTRTASFTVECVVPVAINIRPHGTPNSTNLRLQGVESVAVLTTDAGEYALPLAFDASRIVATTARFGPRNGVWGGTAGAYETHARGHLEDSYELDETTRDGDIDMVLHFRVEDSGLQPGDTEGCVKGTFLGPGGESFKFFGCDAVRIVPQ